MIKCNRTYKVQKVRKGSTKTPYTIIDIIDSQKNVDGTSKPEYLSIFVNGDIDIYNGGAISFSIIDGVRKRTTNYNGKFYAEVTIFVSPENLNVETLGDAPSDVVRPVGEEELPF